MDKEVLEALNDQLNSELYSAYLYLSMAAYFDHMGLSGFSHWMKKQAEEELGHAMKIYGYIYSRGGRVVLKEIKRPPHTWNSVLDVISHALEHEKRVTESIHRLFDLAREKRDRATEVFLHWFIEEQVEEEQVFSEIKQMLEFAGETPQTLLILNSRLAQRK